jgi:hypothetical protein
MAYNPLPQIVIALIILILMGYFAYNIYIMEFNNMIQGYKDIRIQTDILNGVLDLGISGEQKYNTVNPAHAKYKNINASTNQQGGAEYSYNFWLYVDKQKIQENNKDRKDIVLFFKGEKELYYNENANYNCSSDSIGYDIVVTKNPLVRINFDASKLVVDYNNIYSVDSYQHRSRYDKCNVFSNASSWNEKNNNMLGVYDINFNRKWYMVTVVMKEVAERNNVLSNNRAECSIFINGYTVFNSKVETKYNGDIYSATSKNNKSPFYINPSFKNNKSIKEKRGEDFFSPGGGNIVAEGLKIGDVKYFNYAISEDMISGLMIAGLSKKIYEPIVVVKEDEYRMVTPDDFQSSDIKEL